MEAKQRISILKSIISKGGLYGNCAKLYFDDENMAHQFIIECSEQCHNESAVKHWGNKLVLDIMMYSIQFKKKSIFIISY